MDHSFILLKSFCVVQAFILYIVSGCDRSQPAELNEKRNSHRQGKKCVIVWFAESAFCSHR